MASGVRTQAQLGLSCVLLVHFLGFACTLLATKPETRNPWTLGFSVQARVCVGIMQARHEEGLYMDTRPGFTETAS